MGTEADELTTIGLRVPRAVLISDLFAGAAESEELLPEVCDVHRTVVIAGLRDRDKNAAHLTASSSVMLKSSIVQEIN